MATVAWHEGDVIRKLRAVAGVGLEEVALLAKVSITTINRIELGVTKEAKRSTLEKIAGAFGWNARQLSEAVPIATVTVNADAIAMSLKPHLAKLKQRIQQKEAATLKATTRRMR